MRKCSVQIFITGFCYIALVVGSTHSKRTSTEPTNKDLKEGMFSAETQEYFLELETNAQLKYGTRKLPPSKPYYNGKDETRKKDKTKENQTSSSRTEYDSASYEEDESSKSSVEDKIAKKRGKVRFSRQYNPSTVAADSGFVPIPSPFKNQSSKGKAISAEHRRAKLRSAEELTVKESRQNPNILGNGHFEILEGGIFSDQETNEIPGGGRRVGRTFDTFMVPQFRRPSYNVVQYPNVYQGPHLPAHPMFFPRAAY